MRPLLTHTSLLYKQYGPKAHLRQMYNKKHTTTNFLTTLLSALSLFTKASIPTANKAIAKAKKARSSLIIVLLSSVLESVAIIFHIAVAQYKRVDQQLVCTVVTLLINSLEVVA